MDLKLCNSRSTYIEQELIRYETNGPYSALHQGHQPEFATWIFHQNKHSHNRQNVTHQFSSQYCVFNNDCIIKYMNRVEDNLKNCSY